MARSAARMTDELYAPHRPRSAVNTTNATLRSCSRGLSNGLSTSAPPAEDRLRMTSVICSLYGRAACTRACAFTMRLAAISSIARVIFLVDSIDLMRRLRTRSSPPGMLYSLTRCGPGHPQRDWPAHDRSFAGELTRSLRSLARRSCCELGLEV